MKYLLLIIALILASCQSYQHKEVSLGESEHFYNHKFSSLSPASSSIWIGGENGDIWTWDGSLHSVLNAGDNRIYKVVSCSSGTDSLLFVGMRNSGIQKWRFSDGKFHLTHTFSLPHKGCHYSPYDFSILGDSLYAGTSQGLYSISLASDTAIHLLYPPLDTLMQKSNGSFVINNLQLSGDSAVLAACERGIYRFCPSSGHSEISLPNLPVEYVSIVHDTVYAISKSKIFTLSADGKLLDEHSLAFSPRAHYYADGIHYLLTAENLFASRNLDTYTAIPLRRPIPVNYCKNVMTGQPQRPFSLLITENALWDIPYHLSVFGDGVSARVISMADGNLYILCGKNELYLKCANSSEAHLLYKFPPEEQIEGLEAANGRIYYYNSRQEVKVLDLSRHLFVNYFFKKPRTLFRSDRKITAWNVSVQKEGVRIMLGIQDGLIALSEDGSFRSFPPFDHSYITAFAPVPHSELLFFATLNEGEYYLTPDGDIHPFDTNRLSFSTRDLAVGSDFSKQLILLTNRGLCLQHTGDTIYNKEYRKLLRVNDSCFYALPEFGIDCYQLKNEHFKKKERLFSDIHFYTEACCTDGDKIYLGSDLGVLQLTAAHPSGYHSLVFAKNHIFTPLVMLLIGAVAALMAGMSLIYLFRLKIIRRRSIKRRVAEIAAMIAELERFPLLNQSSKFSELSVLKQEVSSIASGRGEYKRRHEMLEKCAEKIIRLNREASIHLTKKLTEQMEELQLIKGDEAYELRHKSKEVTAMDNIEQMMQQVNVNSYYLKMLGEIETEVSVIRESIVNILEIEGISDRIGPMARSVEEGLTTVPMSRLEKEYLQLKDEYDRLQGDETRKEIELYIGKIENSVRELHSDDVTAELLKALEVLRLSDTFHENIAILKQLVPLVNEYEMLRILGELAEVMEVYSQKVNGFIADNNRQINRKFDKELESSIAGLTREESEQIDKLIKDYYLVAAETEHFVVNDVLKLGDGENQQAKVLVLLIAQPKVKRLYIPGMLGIYGNLNPVISRLVNGKIKLNREEMENYAAQYPYASLTRYALQLL